MKKSFMPASNRLLRLMLKFQPMSLATVVVSTASLYPHQPSNPASRLSPL